MFRELSRHVGDPVGALKQGIDGPFVYLASLLGDDFEEDAAVHDDDNPFGEEEIANGFQDSFEPGVLTWGEV